MARFTEQGVMREKTGNLRRGQVMENFECQTEDFIVDPRGNRELLKFVE